MQESSTGEELASKPSIWRVALVVAIPASDPDASTFTHEQGSATDRGRLCLNDLGNSWPI
ncbi:hypothetical protein K239x_57010 [Planctomycetes bacterium K23_9]|uniref:Uncharacterized protein n=1 Tax=Stieleria marina TaxID=1930275 RepID=A0A517P2S8_9BACT|nr:hypothetical protein K239x_57010 [Planctomycetes bacterium K23_9]